MHCSFSGRILVSKRCNKDYREGMSIPDKYQSEFAFFYKEKLSALCDGVEWTMPPIGTKRPQPRTTEDPQALKLHSTSNGAPAINYFPDKARNEAYFAVWMK